jgi:hypothetical protein
MLDLALGPYSAACRDISSFVPIPPNINIIVWLLLLQMVTSKE